MNRTLFERMRTLYRQFPFLTATRLMVAEGIRGLLNPFSFTTYGQTGEDRVIDFFLPVLRPGFYVDVGCHHPFNMSNTLRLYRRGWRGLNVDANPRLVKLFRQKRPRDLSICAAVSDRCGEKTFVVAHAPAMSTLSSDFAKEMLGEKGIKEKIQVQTTTLEKIFHEHQVPHRFDLLLIDVEGHDLEVLMSFNLDFYRPYLIVIEMHGFDIRMSHEHPICNYLMSHQYKLQSYATMNGYFVDAAAANYR